MSFFTKLKELIKKWQDEAPARREAELKRLDSQIKKEEESEELIKKRNKLKELRQKRIKSQSPGFDFGGIK